MSRATGYTGLDNTVDIKLTVSGAGADLSAVARFVLTLKSGTETVVFDSDISADAGVFDATQGGGVIKLSLGDKSLPEVRWAASIVTYDPSNPQGVYWGEMPIYMRAPS